MKMSLHILRHGERLDYVDLLWQRKFKECPSDDPPLAQKGRVQAEEATKKLGEEKIDLIISSPFQRCVETAQIVAAQIGKSILIEPGISEILWTFPPGYQSVSNLKQKFASIDDSYVPIWSPNRKERFDNDCFPRVSKCVGQILNTYPNKNILFVSHRAPIAGIFKYLTKRAHYVGLCTLSRLEKIDNGNWKVIKAGDSSHLSDRSNLRAN